MLALSMSASGGKADLPDTPHQCLLLTPIADIDKVALAASQGKRPINLPHFREAVVELADLP
jgi:hypothetical protein